MSAPSAAATTLSNWVTTAEGAATNKVWTLTGSQTGQATRAKHVFHHWWPACLLCSARGRGSIYRLIMNMCPSRPRCPLSLARRTSRTKDGHTFSKLVGHVELVSVERAIKKLRSSEKQKCLLRQQKHPEYSGTLSDTSVRSSWGDFLYTERKQIQKSPHGIPKKGWRAPQSIIMWDTNKQLHSTPSPVGGGGGDTHLQETRGAAVNRDGACWPEIKLDFKNIVSLAYLGAVQGQTSTKLK